MGARKLNLPLPEETHRSLFEASAELGVPATKLARSALEDWLRKHQAQRTAKEIRAFALEFAGEREDLDPELEEEAISELAGNAPR